MLDMSIMFLSRRWNDFNDVAIILPSSGEEGGNITHRSLPLHPDKGKGLGLLAGR
jgi:hypothetical protein